MPLSDNVEITLSGAQADALIAAASAAILRLEGHSHYPAGAAQTMRQARHALLVARHGPEFVQPEEGLGNAVT